MPGQGNCEGCGRYRSISFFLVNHIHQWQALTIPPDIFRQKPKHPFITAIRHRGIMRSDHEVGTGP
jgi:hypothetical protein